ncbi:hypothetical protein SI65_05819 [Aspergillus cristatus]|uniref:Trafficking protein particle complex subunit 12 n=1 Tax=Aspergillus cristatus TaxID=573508 RepID=A0A1E3BE11_ASPCR|nr:hypothetical protein SI65_05819 [Aspergillus cristatus]
MEFPGPKHPRNLSRSSRPRSSTRGPLAGPDDPLAAETLETDTSELKTASLGELTGTSFYELDPLAPDDLPEALAKDASFLLRYDIYHSLSQVDIPPALRSEFVGLIPDEPLTITLSTVERLLAEGHFLLAAYLCGSILTSSLVSPTDIKLVFGLFYTRLACLELSGHAILAAQESKALEDLTSAFYYVDLNHDTASDNTPDQNHPKHLRHIVPWPLRVLAVRLQSIGFGDSRRGIGGLYELGLEAWREIMRPELSRDEKIIWKERLADLGIRSVNALVEMGDYDSAKRSLHNLRTSGKANDENKLRKALLFLVIGDLDGAGEVFGESDENEKALFKPLLSMAEGNYKDAVVEWQALLESQPKRPDEAMIKQNLAVCLLYTGQLNESRTLFESLVSADHSFSSLIFNMSTVYELCSDKSGQMKAGLVETVARQPISGHANLDRSNADFKL